MIVANYEPWTNSLSITRSIPALMSPLSVPSDSSIIPTYSKNKSFNKSPKPVFFNAYYGGLLIGYGLLLKPGAY